MALTHTEYLETKFFSSLDGLRCFCILAVLWHHSPMAMGGSALGSRGFLGVDVFFVLSGFLIVTLLLREKQQHGTISMKDFYIRRSLRIFPIYFLFVFAALSLAPLMSESSHLRQEVLANWPYMLTFTMNYSPHSDGVFSHLWSLSMEEQFYLVWPFIEWKGGKWVRPLIGCLLIYCLLRDAGIIVSHSPFSRALGWGVALAHLLHSEKGYSFSRKLLGSQWSALAVLCALVTIIALPGEREGWKAILTTLLITSFVAAVIIQPNHLLAPLFRLKPIAYIGTISYGIYLYHIPLITVTSIGCQKCGIEEWGMVFTALYSVSLIAFSAASFHIFERPILKKKASFSRN